MAQAGGERMAGGGLEVFEVIMPYVGAGRDFEQLREHYTWCLSDEHLRAGVSYYELNPVETDAVIEEADRAYREFLAQRQTASIADV